MINAIVGRPRSGKSYEAVRYHIIPAILENKRLVVTNIPVNKEYIEKVHGKEYADLIIIVDGEFHEYGQCRPFSEAKHFLEYDEWKNEKGQGAFFVIDETHLCIGRDATKEVLEYLSMHGHYGHDILVLTQNARKLHRDLKDMIEICWRTVKMSAFGNDDQYIKKTHHGVDNTRESVHTEERSYDPEYFTYYTSHTQSKGSVFEAVAKDVKGQINPTAKWARRLIIFGVIFTVWSVYSAVTGSGTKTDSVETKTVEKAQVEVEKPKCETELDCFKQLNAAVPVDKNEPEQITPKPAIAAPNEVKTINQLEYEEREARSKKYHPYHKVNLHLDGWQQTKETKIIYFAASVNGQKVFRIPHHDLYLAGYDVSFVTECLVEITYFEYSEYITCDVPQIGVTSIAQSN